MTDAIYTQALFVVADVAYLRGVGVVLAFVRTFLQRHRFVTFRMGWVEVLCSVEPLVLLAVTYSVQTSSPTPIAVTVGLLCAALLGLALVLAGAGLLVWSILSWRGLFAGHGVLADHRLVSRGAYGFVRHPVYLAAVLIWLGLAAAYRSSTVTLVTLLYVVPIYLLYIRSEEQMMVEAFGDTYRSYRRVVPMLFPRRWQHPAGDVPR